MRPLTGSEAVVVRTLLGHSLESEESKARDAEVPRTTYQTIRRRAFAEGWVKERYIPAPSLVGARTVSVRLSQPFVEHRRPLVETLGQHADTVVLWAFPDTILSVAFDRLPPSRATAVPPEWLRAMWEVRVERPAQDLPAYFDFEGGWSRRAGLGTPRSYPVGLPRSGRNASSPPREVRELLLRPFLRPTLSPLRFLFSATHLPRRQRRALADGDVHRRNLLDLPAVPPLRSGGVERVVFVTGRPRHSPALGPLLDVLHGELGASPFLAAGSTDRVLLGLLAPIPGPLASPRGSVLAALQVHLERIEILREPTAALSEVVDHRYDRLASPA